MMTEARREALRLAINDGSGQRTPREIVARAQFYLEFLNPRSTLVVDAEPESEEGPLPLAFERFEDENGYIADVLLSVADTGGYSRDHDQRQVVETALRRAAEIVRAGA